VDPLTLLAAANAAVAAVKKGCQLYKDIKGAAGEVKDVLDDLKTQFGKIQNPTNAQKVQYNEEVQRVQEIGKADPNDVFIQIGNDLGALMDEYDKIGKVFIQQEAEAQQVYTGTDSIGKRALMRVIVRSRLDAMLAELRETMVYKAPAELGDLWGKYEKMWQKIVVEQDEAHKRETARLQIEAAQRRRRIRKRKEEAVWVGAILFVVAWFAGLLVLLRLSQTYRGHYLSPWWSCVLC
jgi:methyl-accepting chemotaxis protein